MDTTDILFSRDINSFLAKAQMKAFRENTDPKKVLIRAFLGGMSAEQRDPLTDAFSRVALRYKDKGIMVVFQRFSNDIVRNVYHWTCTELFNRLLAADVHLIPTHLHQGMLGLGDLGTWHVMNILSNLKRLKYHVGVPSGIHTDDGIASQDKYKYYEVLAPLGLCAPTEQIFITEWEMSTENLQRIKK